MEFLILSGVYANSVHNFVLVPSDQVHAHEVQLIKSYQNFSLHTNLRHGAKAHSLIQRLLVLKEGISTVLICDL
jgi:hypothetical protein